MRRKAFGLFAAMIVAAGPLACGGAHGVVAPPDPVTMARDRAASSKDAEVVGKWLLAEMISQGGDAARAKQARARLDEERLREQRGLYASLAKAIYDDAHGRPAVAAEGYLDALRAARASEDPNAELVAWFATSHLNELRHEAPGLWEKARAFVEETIEHPGRIGWRARTDLVGWWAAEAEKEALPHARELTAKRFGCLKGIRLAGPFGDDLPSDQRKSFAAEKPGPWPERWETREKGHRGPRVLKTKQGRCEVESREPTGQGIYYAEAFIDLPAERDVIVSVQRAYAVWIDDHLVLERDTRTWAIWPKFGARVRLPAGRHRILARIGAPHTSIRLMTPDGRPLDDVVTSSDPSAPYSLVAPELLDDPNVLDRFVREGEPLPVDDDVARYLAAFLAHVEEQDDLASVLLEPLMSDPSRATGMTLAAAAVYAARDPIFQERDAHDLVKELRERAVGKDEGLWWPRLWLILDEAEKHGLFEAVHEVRALADEFPEVPDILQGLAHLYNRLGWRVERTETVRLLEQRFPNRRGVLEHVRSVLEEEERYLDADRVADRLRELDPESEIELGRALARRDYAKALEALESLRERRPDRKDIESRITDVKTRAGMPVDPIERLERALTKNPRDASARLRLADARYARGDRLALRKALADAITHGADATELAEAVDLVEGTTLLEPYRLDGLAIIREYEASGETMPGTAARILDYGVNWIHPDGSGRMLEHSIIRIQSQEAIGRLAEHPRLPGLVLRMRVIKRDGTILEPELVPGKPTLTMPHLEVGDYIETEHITSQYSEDGSGDRYVGPLWFFREADVGFYRSELVVISPKERPLQIETHGDVPEPQVIENGPVVVRRFRVDRSHAAPEEPGSPPIQEFLPTVRVGWGIDLEDRLRRLTEALADELPEDPRLRRIAMAIADDPNLPPASEEERARRLYRWVMANIDDGPEEDGRRIVIGKAGSRGLAFRYLARLAKIPVEIGVARDRLTPEPHGPFAEIETLDDYLLRVGSEQPIWMTIGDKFAPFGYLPAELRGMPVIRLVEGLPRETMPKGGSVDGVVYEAAGELLADGSARLEIKQKFVGKLGMGLRASIEQLAESRLHDIVESRLVGRALPGAKLVSMTVENQENLDEPLVLAMTVEVPELAQRRGNELAIDPPLALQISQLASLPSRETPLLMTEPTYAEIRFSLKLPEGARAKLPQPTFEVKDAERLVRIKDRQEGGLLVLDRLIDIPSGRVEPSAYPSLKSFARDADEAMSREIVIAMP